MNRSYKKRTSTKFKHEFNLLIKRILFTLSLVFLVSGSILLCLDILSSNVVDATSSSSFSPLSRVSEVALWDSKSLVEFSELKSNLTYVFKDFQPFFELSIPSIGLESVSVQTNAPTLKPDIHLGHLRGSALPGASGDVFIYGHSSFPFLFDGKDMQSIFSTLDKLEIGREVSLKYGSENFRYIVQKIEVIDIQDVPQPELQKSAKSLYLLTCFPFGSSKKRLLVTASLNTY